MGRPGPPKRLGPRKPREGTGGKLNPPAAGRAGGGGVIANKQLAAQSWQSNYTSVMDCDGLTPNRQFHIVAGSVCMPPCHAALLLR